MSGRLAIIRRVTSQAIYGNTSWSPRNRPAEKAPIGKLTGDNGIVPSDRLATCAARHNSLPSRARTSRMAKCNFACAQTTMNVVSNPLVTISTAVSQRVACANRILSFGVVGSIASFRAN